MSNENKITFAEYWKEIATLAKDISREARKEKRDVGDVLHETLDGHLWVIYIWAHFWVLMHSDNENAIFDEQGAQTFNSFSELAPAVYMAMYADVTAHSNFKP